MAALAPFALDPRGGFDRFTAYWFATVCNAVYLPASAPRLFLYQLVGGVSLTRVQPTPLAFPWADVSFTLAGQAIVVTRGTATSLEMLLQAAGVGLSSSAPWPGQVGGFWSAATNVLFQALKPLMQAVGTTNVVWSGHSFGGAVSTLMPDLALDDGPFLTDAVCTVAGPRAGDLAFAQEQSPRFLRLTNHGDPVPMVPPSANSVLDRTLWILSPVPFTSFWHAGTRVHLFEDGRTAMPPEQSTWASSEEAMIGAARIASGWYNAHNTNEYARRLRIGIPAPWLTPSTEFPDIDVLDGYWATADIDPPASTWFQAALCPNV